MDEEQCEHCGRGPNDDQAEQSLTRVRTADKDWRQPTNRLLQLVHYNSNVPGADMLCRLTCDTFSKLETSVAAV